MIDILMVCTGNLCRSPMAEALLQSKLLEEYPSLAAYIKVHSAGTSAIEGNPATSSAVQAMDLWGIDIEPHRASELTADLLRGADLVLAMAREHLMYIGRIERGALGKSTTLKHLASMAGVIEKRLGDETVRDVGQAASRIAGVLEVLQESVPAGDFMGDIQARSSDIIDPIGSSLRVYLGVAEEIESSLEKTVRALFGRPEATPDDNRGHREA